MIRLLLGLTAGALFMQFYLEAGYRPPWTAHELREQVRGIVEELVPQTASVPAPTVTPPDEGLCLAPQRFALPFFATRKPASDAAQPSARDRTEALVRSEAEAAGLSPELVVALVSIESSFNPRAKPRQGASSALGLFQFVRATRERYGVTDDKAYLGDVGLQVRLGVRHLAALRERFGGSYIDTLLAYHVGETPVVEDRVPPLAFEYVDRVLDEMARMKQASGTS